MVKYNVYITNIMVYQCMIFLRGMHMDRGPRTTQLKLSISTTGSGSVAVSKIFHDIGAQEVVKVDSG